MDVVGTPPCSAIRAHFGDKLEKLTRKHDLDYSESFLEGSGNGVALLLDDPDTAPESWDMAVIFPELLATLDERPRAAVVPPAEARVLRSRYGIGRLPSMLFLRDGGYVGVIEGLRDWSELKAETQAMLKKQVGRVRIGLAVAPASATGCGHEGAG